MHCCVAFVLGAASTFVWRCFDGHGDGGIGAAGEPVGEGRAEAGGGRCDVDAFRPGDTINMDQKLRPHVAAISLIARAVHPYS